MALTTQDKTDIKNIVKDLLIPVNAKLTALDQKVVALDAQVDAIDSKANSLGESLGTMNDDIAILTGVVTARFDALDNALTALAGALDSRGDATNALLDKIRTDQVEIGADNALDFDKVLTLLAELKTAVESLKPATTVDLKPATVTTEAVPLNDPPRSPFKAHDAKTMAELNAESADVPDTASGWELYDTPNANAAAHRLALAVRKAMAENMTFDDAYHQAIEAFEREADFGAMDTEPRGILAEVLANYYARGGQHDSL